jgi:hypothetical protein
LFVSLWFLCVKRPDLVIRPFILDHLDIGLHSLHLFLLI